MHQFVEPPRLGRVVVSLFVASWEIECCAPPPTVGEWTSWPVFVFPGEHPGPGVRDHGLRAASGPGRVLVDGAVVAYRDEGRWGPRPGSARVSAELCGTVHGGTVPDDLPTSGSRPRPSRRGCMAALAALGGVRAVDMTGSAPMSDEQWFWCFTHNTVEPLEGCPAKDRLGPYPDKATAARAVEIAHERTEKWDKEDEDWEWGPNK